MYDSKVLLEPNIKLQKKCNDLFSYENEDMSSDVVFQNNSTLHI